MCHLQKDQKTYEYIKMFMSCTTSVMTYRLENEIQAREIRRHLELNHINEQERNREAIKWIKENGKKFREYIETMKKIVEVHEVKDHEDFCYIIDMINGELN